MSAVELRKAAENLRGDSFDLMDPTIAVALADWLDFVVAVGEPGRRNGLTGEPYDFPQALAVARLINGGA